MSWRRARSASQMKRPSRTLRFPLASLSLNRGIIHSSGVNLKARRSSSISLARVVFPDAGRPTMTNSVGVVGLKASEILVTEDRPTQSPTGALNRGLTEIQRSNQVIIDN